ncbi:MAG: acyl-CoA dehydratase activase-related protein [Actinomycetaceae bacterium]|nr:acyl-CoA dehydratase activase-related protein [Actinomycetaceae bacterium]
MQLGIDIGSTTVKAVVLDGHTAVFQDYRRHNADVREELARLLDDIATDLPAATVYASVTGSGGMAVSEILGIPFIQEVIAETQATRINHPDADVIIELGGEDAKLTYLKPTPEQRMNGTCAGGTGAFIDQMATLLKTDAAGLNDLASRSTHLYPIASRCGVFAKTDLQPLINQGAAHEDLAASVFAAVATQTVAGLAAGRPIRGHVMFLGGPLHFLPELRKAYENILDKATGFVTPPNAQLYVALGAAMMSTEQTSEPQNIAALNRKLREAEGAQSMSHRLPPLFQTPKDYEQFHTRHARAHITQIPTDQATGTCFLGIDAGSTTIKAVVIDEKDRIVFTHYASNEGDPLKAAKDIVRHIHEELPPEATILRACSTGYGEGLVQAALKVDEGEVETMAHYRAAEYVLPGVTSVIDIGGQDMKYLRIKDSAVDSISVNEACSSGCGSFLQTFAETMGQDIHSFAQAALKAPAPVDLGTRCTVFMNSSVKQAQKEGADVGDISAGLSYSVIRNALYKVIKLKDASDLGDKVVVQGGTFLNDAVLRAFETLTGLQVVRPNLAGLMGAYGAALTARKHWQPGQRSTLLGVEDLEKLEISSELKVCRLCQNHCQMTVTSFSTGERHVSGNRCERGASLEKLPAKSPIPNMFDWKYKRLFAYRRLTEKAATRGDIGIPRVLNMYENYPFWFTVLTELKFRVMISGRSSHDLFEEGMESIPSENVCYPAKLVHGHVKSLLDKGIRTIFYPSVTYEHAQTQGQDNCFNCPVVATYSEVIRTNMEELDGNRGFGAAGDTAAAWSSEERAGFMSEVLPTSIAEGGQGANAEPHPGVAPNGHDGQATQAPKVRFLNPFFNLANPDHLATRLVEVFSDWNVTLPEAKAALAAGFEEDAAFKAEVMAKGDEALRYMVENNVRGIVLAGRPYHLDPEVNHGIPEVINGLGMAVLTEDSMVRPGTLERPLRVRDQWAYHSRLYEAAGTVGTTPYLSLVQLVSFGCGVDAVTADQVQEILEGAHDVYTGLKIDEVSNLGAARIRLRSLAAALEERKAGQAALNGANALGNELESEEIYTYPAGRDKETPLGLRGEQYTNHPESKVLIGAEAGLKATGHGHVYPRYTKEMREAGYTILVPQMAPIQFRLAAPVMQRFGYNVQLLEHASKEDIELGLKYVNNDACYPAIVVIGQLMNRILKGEVDANKCVVAISQTGGMCRATNYAGLLRKALRDAGLPQIPVLAISAQGFEDNPGFEFTLPMLNQLIRALTLGDMLQKLLLRVRPYEATPGAATRLYEKWDQAIREFFEHKGYMPSLGVKLSFTGLIKRAVHEFDTLPLADVPRKPRVGLVGEILVKFHPDANNHAVRTIEEEGCEAVLPGLMQFFHAALVVGEWKEKTLATHTGKTTSILKAVLWILQQYEKPVNRALAKSERFEAGASINELAMKAQEICSLGNQAGEGWYLTAEMMEMIESGCPNIICAQPFACLPNHIIGKGMFRALRAHYPQANVVAIDYDPGASEVNQLNRIKLMVSTAFLQHEGDEWAGGEQYNGRDQDTDFDPTEGFGISSGCAAGGCAPSGCGLGGQEDRLKPVPLGMPRIRRS